MNNPNLNTFRKVATEQSFQKLPIQAQVYYFHMLARAEDDGRVPLPYKIYFMLDAVDDFFEFPPEAIEYLKNAGLITEVNDEIYILQR